jgi:cation diffusion facilitator family transporter
MVSEIQTSRAGTSAEKKPKYRSKRRDLLDPAAEQRGLKVSIGATVVIGVMGIGGGLMMGSRAIMFDGMYSFVDVLLTCGALAVSKLVVREPTQQFQFGYWHLEPMVGSVQSAILVTACLYGAVNAVQGLIGGGYEVSFGWGALWSGIMGAAGMTMAVYIGRLAQVQRSLLLEIDYRSWLLSGVLSLALLVAYGLAFALQDTAYQGWAPYIDPAMLLVLSVALLPMPLKVLFDAMRDVLRVAPEGLDRQVRLVMDELVRERGFTRYTSYVSQMGRLQFVEIHILVPRGFTIGTVDTVDGLRREISGRLGATWPEVWLTVDMTANSEWI